jgi:hypothetical protein
MCCELNIVMGFVDLGAPDDLVAVDEPGTFVGFNQNL